MRLSCLEKRQGLEKKANSVGAMKLHYKALLQQMTVVKKSMGVALEEYDVFAAELRGDRDKRAYISEREQEQETAMYKYCPI